jgi:hypothetical protein
MGSSRPASRAMWAFSSRLLSYSRIFLRAIFVRVSRGWKAKADEDCRQATPAGKQRRLGGGRSRRAGRAAAAHALSGWLQRLAEKLRKMQATPWAKYQCRCSPLFACRDPSRLPSVCHAAVARCTVALEHANAHLKVQDTILRLRAFGELPTTPTPLC